MGAFTIEALKVPTCCFFKGANANTYGAWCVNTRNVRI